MLARHLLFYRGIRCWIFATLVISHKIVCKLQRNVLYPRRRYISEKRRFSWRPSTTSSTVASHIFVWTSCIPTVSWATELTFALNPFRGETQSEGLSFLTSDPSLPDLRSSKDQYVSPHGESSSSQTLEPPPDSRLPVSLNYFELFHHVIDQSKHSDWLPHSQNYRPLGSKSSVRASSGAGAGTETSAKRLWMLQRLI